MSLFQWLKLIPYNPFNITKAVDYTDEELNKFWVDFPGDSFSNSINEDDKSRFEKQHTIEQQDDKD